MIHCLIVLANKLTLIVKGPFTTLSQGFNLIWMSKHLNCVKISKVNSYCIYSNRRKILSDKKINFFPYNLKMPMGGDIQDWFKSLPLFTRYWFGGTILFTLLGRFGLLQPAWLVLYLEPLIHRFQVSVL